MKLFFFQSSESPVEEKPNSEKSYTVATWPTSTTGHTGYLTVATLPPTFIRKKSSPNNVEIQKDLTSSEPMSVDTTSS
ncbi:hypothetical protein RR48_07330 [Papilio machaon]|uniref:Uncharacterized protein n=1 Tax=Papilio machaon TaxID=76193 RepID=A0A194RJC7_PAPMA|nr:hypothetical protein RR48_07330 [Papilio machaon]